MGKFDSKFERYYGCRLLERVFERVGLGFVRGVEFGE